MGVCVHVLVGPPIIMMRGLPHVYFWLPLLRAAFSETAVHLISRCAPTDQLFISSVLPRTSPCSLTAFYVFSFVKVSIDFRRRFLYHHPATIPYYIVTKTVLFLMFLFIFLRQLLLCVFYENWKVCETRLSSVPLCRLYLFSGVILLKFLYHV